MPHLAIVGAGAAGLAAAFALRSDSLRVTVFEKSRGLAGRAATRWRDAEDGAGEPFRWRYDHGAQYVSAPEGSRAYRLLTDDLDTTGLVDFDGRVWPFDDDGTLRPDRAKDDPSPHLTYRDGIADLGRRLAEAAGEAEIRRQTRVGALHREGSGWRLESDAGDDLGTFDAVLLTPPAPQTADLLRASTLSDRLRQRLVGALRPADYRAQFTVVLAFTAPVARPEPYALVNADEHGGTGGGHPVAWLAVESDKPGRAPEGGTLLLAQMAPDWTEAHYDDERASVVREATREMEALLDTRLPKPAWTDSQRWRYALPNEGADAEALHEAASEGLFFAGDAVAGKGRVHLALESGLEAAERIRAAL
ncbi:MAG TPA: FAD-binding protein [Rhodothermales bacterium]|nr:FAD-binding protein [Rhodothermales bacterium]